MRIKHVATFAVTGALALSLSACGGNSNNSASGGASAAPSPVADINNLTGVMTQVTLDSDFVKGLSILGLTPGTVGPATISSAGVATFPITGGNAIYYKPGTVDPYVQGIIHHKDAGLSLTAGNKKVELKNFDVDPGKSMLFGDVFLNGQPVVMGAPLFFLDGSTLQPLQVEGGTAILQGTTVKISPEAAQLLNKTFGTDKVMPFATVGVAKITLALPGK